MEQRPTGQIPTGYLRISITDRCNMKCIYCHNEGQAVGRGSRDLSVEDFRYIIVNALRFGLRKVRVTGGEPLVHPHCIDILHIAKAEEQIAVVGLNTNGTNRGALLAIARQALVDDLTVGVDYQDGLVSKNSPLGVPSQVVLETIEMVKDLGQHVAIACVFDGDVGILEKMTAWCVKHAVMLKILQMTDGHIDKGIDHDFTSMADRINDRFALRRQFLPTVGDYYGVAANGTRVSFLHSHCRTRECDKCGHIHMRVTARGGIKTCIQEAVEFPLLSGEFDKSLQNAVANVGLSPEVRHGAER